MNKPIKILLLAVALIAAIWGVLFYMKTIVSPPQKLSFTNQYEIQLTKDIEDFRKCDQTSLEHDFVSLSDKAYRFWAESVIDEKSYDNNYTEIIGVYSPKFAQYCFGQFSKSVWDSNDLAWMEDRIDQLRDLTVENGSKKIMDDFNETDGKFTIILKTIQKYREARALSNKTSYSGLQEARDRINKANQYKQDDYLKNNASLVKALNNLPSLLEASHYANLCSQVKNLANYYICSENYYDAMSDKVVAALKEYKKNAQSVYGKERSIASLEYDASCLYNAAVEYYKKN